MKDCITIQISLKIAVSEFSEGILARVIINIMQSFSQAHVVILFNTVFLKGFF